MTAAYPAPTGDQQNSAVPGRTGSGRWYFVITIVSAGLLAWVPFAHAANRLGRRSLVKLAGLYGVGAAAVCTLLALTPQSDGPEEVVLTTGQQAMSTISGLLMLSMIAIACVQQSSLRRQVYSRTPPPVVATDPALASALAARERRAAARTLVADDPLIARELRIGRPDLPRTYDDGGLVDLNSAPAPVIAALCGLSTETAENIVQTRTTCGGFLAVDDVFSMADVPVATWDIIRDRGIVLTT